MLFFLKEIIFIPANSTTFEVFLYCIPFPHSHRLNHIVLCNNMVNPRFIPRQNRWNLLADVIPQLAKGQVFIHHGQWFGHDVADRAITIAQGVFK